MKEKIFINETIFRNEADCSFETKVKAFQNIEEAKAELKKDFGEAFEMMVSEYGCCEDDVETTEAETEMTVNGWDDYDYPLIWEGKVHELEIQ